MKDDPTTLEYASRRQRLPSSALFAWCVVGWGLAACCVGPAVLVHSEILSLGEGRNVLLMVLALLVILEAGIAVVGSPLLLFMSGVTVEHGGAKATLLVLASLLRCSLAVWSFGVLSEAFRLLM